MPKKSKPEAIDSLQSERPANRGKESFPAGTEQAPEGAAANTETAAHGEVGIAETDSPDRTISQADREEVLESTAIVGEAEERSAVDSKAASAPAEAARPKRARAGSGNRNPAPSPTGADDPALSQRGEQQEGTIVDTGERQPENVSVGADSGAENDRSEAAGDAGAGTIPGEAGERTALAAVADAAPTPAGAAIPKKPSKKAMVLALLRRPEGVSIAELMQATGWQAHSVRAVLTGFRKDGLEPTRSKDEAGVTRYRIAAEASDA